MNFEFRVLNFELFSATPAILGLFSFELFLVVPVI